MDNVILSQFSAKDLATEIVVALKPEIIAALKEQLGISRKEKYEYLSKSEAARKLKITTRTLSQWTKVGTVAALRIGRKVLYKEEDIEKALTVIKTTKAR